MNIKEAKQQLFEGVKDYSVISTTKAFENIMGQLKESIEEEYKIAISQNFLVEGEIVDDEDEDEEEDGTAKKVNESGGDEDNLDDDESEELKENPLIAGVIGKAVKDKLAEADASVKTPEDEDKRDVKDSSAKTNKKSNTNGKANRSGK